MLTFEEYMEINEDLDWKSLAKSLAITGAVTTGLSGASVEAKPIDQKTVNAQSQEIKHIVWETKVSPAFKEKVIDISKKLGINPNDLMAAMAFETGETFSSSIRSHSGSGAVGLIQFMQSTAKMLGTSQEALSQMSAEDQLDYVYKYLLPYKGRMSNLEDIYMAILYPAAVGKSSSHVLFVKGTTAYKQNVGLDADKDGKITIGEAAAKVREKLSKGFGFIKKENKVN